MPVSGTGVNFIQHTLKLDILNAYNDIRNHRT